MSEIICYPMQLNMLYMHSQQQHNYNIILAIIILLNPYCRVHATFVTQYKQGHTVHSCIDGY